MALPQGEQVAENVLAVRGSPDLIAVQLVQLRQQRAANLFEIGHGSVMSEQPNTMDERMRILETRRTNSSTAHMRNRHTGVKPSGGLLEMLSMIGCPSLFLYERQAIRMFCHSPAVAMRQTFAILHALGHPERIETSLTKSRITDFPELTFTEVEEGRYPCFKLAVEAGMRGGNMPAVLNSANEVAVGAFLAGVVPFPRIQEIIAAALDGIVQEPVRSYDDVCETDRATRAYIREKFGV